MRKVIRFALLLSVSLSTLPPLARAAERWKIQYFYDKPDVAFVIRDFQCPSADHCVAIGSIDDKKGHSKGAVLWTTDTGQKWTLGEISDQPASLFFLNDNLGWMAAEHGLWSSTDGGKTWKKIDSPKKGVLETYFLDPQHGYSVGIARAVYETHDSGKKWIPLPAAAGPDIPLNTVFESIAFLGNHGVIVGNAGSQYDDDAAIWLDPSNAREHRERAATVVMLETTDGGATWVSHRAPLRGRLTQLVMVDKDSALALFEYHNYYALPSRVYEMRFPTGMESIFAEHDRAVTDIQLLPSGETLLASVEPPGASNQVPIPGKLKILKSTNLKVWEEMDVDYHAVAQRAMLAGPDAQHVWVATDTGMILKLTATDAAAPARIPAP